MIYFADRRDHAIPFVIVVVDANILPLSFLHYKYYVGVFEQLARYTLRQQESDLHLGLYSSLSTANNLNLPTLSYFSLPTSSSIVAVFIAKAGHVWVS